MYIHKFDEKGVPDAHFGKNGTVVEPSSLNGTFRMVMDPKGRYLLAQTAYETGYTEIERLLPTGEVDKTFGADGLVIATGGFTGSGAFTGNTLAASGSKDSFFLMGLGSKYDPVFGFQYWKILEKYTESGTLDPDFGDLGRVKFFLDGEL